MHDPAPFCSLHTALAPHGLGVHGIAGGSWITGKVLRERRLVREV